MPREPRNRTQPKPDTISTDEAIGQARRAIEAAQRASKPTGRQMQLEFICTKYEMAPEFAENLLSSGLGVLEASKIARTSKKKIREAFRNGEITGAYTVPPSGKGKRPQHILIFRESLDHWIERQKKDFAVSQTRDFISSELAFEKSEESAVPVIDLRSYYMSYCEAKGQKPVSSHKFNLALVELVSGAYRKTQRFGPEQKPSKVWKHIRIKGL